MTTPNTVVVAVPPAHRGEGSFERLYRRAQEVTGGQAKPLGGNRLRVPVEDAAAILSGYEPAEDDRYEETRSAAPDVDDLPDGTRKAHRPTGAGPQPEIPGVQTIRGRDGGAPDVDDLPDGERAAHTPTGAGAQPEKPGDPTHPTPTKARRGPAKQEG